MAFTWADFTCECSQHGFTLSSFCLPEWVAKKTSLSSVASSPPELDASEIRAATDVAGSNKTSEVLTIVVSPPHLSCSSDASPAAQIQCLSDQVASLADLVTELFVQLSGPGAPQVGPTSSHVPQSTTVDTVTQAGADPSSAPAFLIPVALAGAPMLHVDQATAVALESSQPFSSHSLLHHGATQWHRACRSVACCKFALSNSEHLSGQLEGHSRVSFFQATWHQEFFVVQDTGPWWQIVACFHLSVCNPWQLASISTVLQVSAVWD